LHEQVGLSTTGLHERALFDSLYVSDQHFL